MDMKISGESSTLVLTSSLPAVAFTDGKQKLNLIHCKNECVILTHGSVSFDCPKKQHTTHMSFSVRVILTRMLC